MIGAITEYNELIIELIEEMAEEEGEDICGYTALEEIKRCDFGDECPYMKKSFAKRIPLEYRSSTTNRDMLYWMSRCEDYPEKDIEFIRDNIPHDELPEEMVFPRINDGGCRECWMFNYFFIAAHFIANDGFWKFDEVKK